MQEFITIEKLKVIKIYSPKLIIKLMTKDHLLRLFKLAFLHVIIIHLIAALKV